MIALGDLNTIEAQCDSHVMVVLDELLQMLGGVRSQGGGEEEGGGGA